MNEEWLRENTDASLMSRENSYIVGQAAITYIEEDHVLVHRQLVAIRRVWWDTSHFVFHQHFVEVTEISVVFYYIPVQSVWDKSLMGRVEGVDDSNL